MIPAPIPENEQQRLEALRSLLLLDTKPEERFDRITQFASFEFDVPVALFTLIDEDRQWFKSLVGTDVCSTPRNFSFCGHAILRDELMIVEDALEDERFFDNPLVINPPHVRFYLGAPIVLSTGIRVGTLCLIDFKPRHFDDTDLSIMATLRNMVEDELTQRTQEIKARVTQ
jgi:GAF domain-containing protein